MLAAAAGHTTIVEALVQRGADVDIKRDGKTAGDIALENHLPTVCAIIEPNHPELQTNKAFKRRFEDADIVLVFSVKFRRDRDQPRESCDPFKSAANAKAALEKREGVMAFNPNYDNAKFQAGQAELANAIWLLTWREMLELARAKGGCVVQMLVPPGLSKMQEAEADMAKDKGVPVVVLDCRQVKGCTTEAQLEAMPEWAKLISMIDTPQGERTIPRTREELETNELVLQHENQQLRAQLARLEGVPPQRD